jgi:hypothetical protein
MPFKTFLKETRITITVIDSHEIRPKKEIESTTTSRSILSSIKEATPIKEKEQKNAIEEKLEMEPLEFQKTKTFLSRMVTILEFNQSIEKRRGKRRKKSQNK